MYVHIIGFTLNFGKTLLQLCNLISYFHPHKSVALR